MREDQQSGQHFCSKWTGCDPVVMNNNFLQTLLNFILSDNSTVRWSKKPSIVLLRIRFKDRFFVLKGGKEHTWQPTNNKPVEVSYVSKRMKCLQTENVFHLPLSPGPGRWFWTHTLLSLVLKKLALARTVDSRRKPSADGRGCVEQAQIPSAGITVEQSWRGADFKQSQVQRGPGWKLQEGIVGKGVFPPSFRQLSCVSV